MNKENLAVIFCPNVSDYPKQPRDISKAEKVNCPECNELMWFSTKKKSVKAFCESVGKDVIFCCGRCLPEQLKAKVGNIHFDEFTQVQL